MKPATLLPLKNNLKKLKLLNMLCHFEEQNRQAQEDGLAYDEFLLALTKTLPSTKPSSRLKRHHKKNGHSQFNVSARFYNWSGREDLNLRPPEPHSGTLPSCATSRFNN